MHTLMYSAHTLYYAYVKNYVYYNVLEVTVK
jgi:hypothetical protein